MKIKQIRIKNFRSYSDQVCVDIKDLTAFVGKNDAGKSTILEALDIFFNDNRAINKIDVDDINCDRLNINDTNIRIDVIFQNLPESLIIDESNETNLNSEYLLDKNKNLHIFKIYDLFNKNMTCHVFYICV